MAEIIVEGQGSRIANATGGVYISYVPASETAEALAEAIVGALVRRMDQFRLADIVPSPEIAPYILVQPSQLAVPAGAAPFGPGDYTFTVSLRAPFRQQVRAAISERKCADRCRRPTRTRTVQGSIRVVVDGGIIGQIFVEIVLPIDANSRCAASDDRSCC